MKIMQPAIIPVDALPHSWRKGIASFSQLSNASSLDANIWQKCETYYSNKYVITCFVSVASTAR